MLALVQVDVLKSLTTCRWLRSSSFSASEVPQPSSSSTIRSGSGRGCRSSLAEAYETGYLRCSSQLVPPASLPP